MKRCFVDTPTPLTPLARATRQSDMLEELRENLADRLRPWNRSVQFWVRAADIYTGYKVCQLRAGFVKDVEEREAMWERQHELAADKMYSLCSELGGLFLKAAQILGKPDLAPAAWVKRLVTLCDKAPATRIGVVKQIIEKELGRGFYDVFEQLDEEPVGSASIAQVHRARLRSSQTNVAVKVQHPGVEYLMQVDIHNLQAFVLFLQKTDIKFDLFSLTKEVEKQIGYEFDFLREAYSMERIRNSLTSNNKKPPVSVPRVIKDMVTRDVLVMEFMEGTPIMNLGNEMAKRGINPGGKIASMAKQKILQNLTIAYGQMILRDGYFHADPHPGNILVRKDSEVALLDYGQVKELPESLRLGYANLVLAMADNNFTRAVESFKELGISTTNNCSHEEEEELLKLSSSMFDTRMPPGVTVLSPFSEDSSLKKVSVQIQLIRKTVFTDELGNGFIIGLVNDMSFPEELFSVLRTVQLLRGLSVGLGINYSCSEQWRPIAEEALYKAGRLKGNDMKSRKRGIFSRIFRRQSS